MEKFTPKGPSQETVRAEVKSAITAHLRGESEGYDTIKEIFSGRKSHDEGAETSNADMKAYLLALTSHASLLSKGCSGLVKAILGCEWMGREEDFVKSYVYFLGSLASSQGVYVSMILTMLVGHFLEGKPSPYHHVI